MISISTATSSPVLLHRLSAMLVPHSRPTLVNGEVDDTWYVARSILMQTGVRQPLHLDEEHHCLSLASAVPMLLTSSAAEQKVPSSHTLAPSAPNPPSLPPIHPSLMSSPPMPSPPSVPPSPPLNPPQASIQLVTEDSEHVGEMFVRVAEFYMLG